MPSISVIIVSYYTGPTLWLSIASALYEQECREVIIVNNGNMLGDEKRLRDMAAKDQRVRLLSGHGNVGFGKGNNLGVANATGDYVLLLNPDSMLPKGGPAILLDEIRRYPENTLAGCYLINSDGSEQRGGRRALLTAGNAITESIGFSKGFNYHRQPMPDKTHEVPAISGAFMFLARAFYERLKGFDEGYFLHMEDMDFCYRVHQAGGKVICIPAVKTLHFRSTSEVASVFIEKHKARGFIRYLRKQVSKRHVMMFLEAGIWLRFFLKVIFIKMDSLFTSPLEAKQEIARLALLYDLAYFHGQDSSLAGKTILVTDAVSQIGLAVVGKALAKGAKVIGVHSDNYITFLHHNLQWQYCDFKNAEDMKAFAQLRADICVHTADPTLLPDLLQKFPGDAYSRIIAFSSFLVADEAAVRKHSEKEKIKKIKTAESEILRLCKEQARNATILRPFMPYGVGLDQSITPLASVMKRFGFAVVYRSGQGLRNPVQVGDVADAVLAVIDNPKTYEKTYDLGGGEELSYSDMVLIISDYIGKTVRQIRPRMVPFILNLLGAVYKDDNLNGEVARRMNRNIIADNTPAIQDFDYRDHRFLEGDVTI